ncbi:MAG: hypothetical protein C5B50_16325 [Verrucomicrobia bacterium]|nr:MAG: hypothetical protein C5B50_16325 [Verrucomicrobiota bacterium]
MFAAVVLGGLLACATVATAQDAGKDAKKGKMSAEQRLERMSKELNLTDEQKPKVKKAMEDMDKTMKEARDLDQSERREKVTAARDDMRKKMKEILTADQFTKWEEFMKAQGKRRKGGAPDEKSSEGKSENKSEKKE